MEYLPLFVVFTFMLGATGMSQDTNAGDTCETEFRRIVGDASILNIADKVTQWEALRPACSSSGIYAFRLGLLYIQAKRFDDAKTSFDLGSNPKGAYMREYQFGYAELELAKGNVTEAQSRFERLKADYPDWHLPYFKLGQMSVSAQKFSDAKSYFEASLRREPKAETYGFLAICNHQLGFDRETIEDMNKALAVDPSMAGYRNGMIAAAVSALKLGQLQHATNALAILAKTKPDVKDDAEFLRLIVVLKEKLQQAK